MYNQNDAIHAASGFRHKTDTSTTPSSSYSTLTLLYMGTGRISRFYSKSIDFYKKMEVVKFIQREISIKVSIQ